MGKLSSFLKTDGIGSTWQLALGNVQGELDPPEIGVDALGLELGTPGRGKKGGLRVYTGQIGQAAAERFTVSSSGTGSEIYCRDPHTSM
jgi:hypothetical protein